MSIFKELAELERRHIWDHEYKDAPAWQQAGVAVARAFLYLYHEFSNGALNLRAMSLVYTTILSLVPLIAFSFSILKGFGVQNQVEPLLLQYLQALGPDKAQEITDNVVGFVNNIDVRFLGAVGLGLLVYTIVTLMKKIESAFNHAWHIAADRSFAERFTTFVSVLTVGPLLVLSAMAITGSVMSNSLMMAITQIEPFGTIAAQLTRLSPFILVISAFTFVYVLIPNTRVRFVPALVGGITAGLLWETAGYAFALFVSTASSYQAVYATFGTAMFFMIWLYVSWLILLVGASVAYYIQHPRVVIARARRWRFSVDTYEAVALAILRSVVKLHYAKEPPLNVEALSDIQGLPPELLRWVLNALTTSRILTSTNDDKPAYVLTVPPEETMVIDVLRALRKHQIQGSRRVDSPLDPVVSLMQQRIDGALAAAFEQMRLKDLTDAAG